VHYQLVQPSYRGWNRLAVIVIGGLVSSFLLTLMVREDPKQFILAGSAFSGGSIPMPQALSSLCLRWLLLSSRSSPEAAA
jgi:hypothetical protein